MCVVSEHNDLPKPIEDAMGYSWIRNTDGFIKIFGPAIDQGMQLKYINLERWIVENYKGDRMDIDAFKIAIAQNNRRNVRSMIKTFQR